MTQKTTQERDTGAGAPPHAIDIPHTESHYQDALRLAPQSVAALNAYGTFLIAGGRYGEAESLVRRAYALTPNNPEVLNNLGTLQQKRGMVAEAERLFIQAIRLNPSWAPAHASLGRLLLDTGRQAHAEKAFRHAIKLDAGSAAGWSGLGLACLALGRDDEGIDCLRHSLSLNARDEAVWVRLIGVLEARNRLDDACQAVNDAKQHIPSCPGVIIYEAKLLDREGKPEEALAVMQKCYDSMQTSAQPDHPFFAGFFTELGKLHDRAGNIDEAFFFFKKKNAVRAADPAARKIDKTRLTREISYIRDRFDSGLGSSPGAPGMGAASPVFLVGFPRSGTTLLEQVLSSHPRARATEELPAVDRMAQKLRRQTPKEYLDSIAFPAGGGSSFASCVLPIDAAAIDGLREAFFAEHSGWDGSRLLVDKHPMNMLHAGLISRIFPDTKFVLALRHPCDAVLSCYMQRFGFNSAMARFLDLEDSARFYDEAFGLWEHYRKVLDLNVHTIRYEDVVADFKPTVAALLSFLGLEWDDAVLEYDKTAREKGRIKTPSYTQVTQKIYTRASGRWLKYRKHLEPILPILEPHVLKYGYSMEDSEGQE